MQRSWTGGGNCNLLPLKKKKKNLHAVKETERTLRRQRHETIHQKYKE